MLLEFTLFLATVTLSTNVCQPESPVIGRGDKTTVFCTCPSVKSWSSSQGKISGTGTSVIFDPKGMRPGTVTVNAVCPEGTISTLITVVPMIPAPPVAYSCSVTAPLGEIFPGDPVTITGTATNFDGRATATFTWKVDPYANISVSTNVATIDTKGLSPGSYAVLGLVKQKSKKYVDIADCTATFVINHFMPPTAGCLASPPSIPAGGTSTIRAEGLSPQNRPLTYHFSATSGTLSVNGSEATFQAAGGAPGPVIVTCEVSDDQNQTATQNVTVNVSHP